MSRLARPSFDGGRDDAGRDQFDEYGNPIYTDEQVREFVDFYSGYLDTGADYFEIDDVDEVDRYYDRSFGNAIARAGINLFRRDDRGKTQQVKNWIKPDRYIEATGAPEYLKNLFAPNKRRDETEAQNAYAALAAADSPEQTATVLSEYYGYDFSPVTQKLGKFGGNLKSHTDSSGAQLAEFHSFVEPILKDQITYLQATQGLNYQDALKVSFEADPMLQGLYGKYGVTPVRQTDDGSTYVYDPFTYGELRTFESKDRDFQNALKIVGALAFAYYAPKLILKSGLLDGLAATGAGAGAGAGTAATTYTTAQTAAAAAITSGSLEAIKGGDLSDILTAAATGGLAAGGMDLIKAIPIPPQTSPGGMVTISGKTLGDILPEWNNVTFSIGRLGVSPTSAQGMLTTAATLFGSGGFNGVFGDGASDVMQGCFLLAQQIAEEEGVSSPTNTDIADFFDEALEIYNDLRDDGYSHLRIMDEMGYDPSEDFTQQVQESDLARLQELRGGTDQAAYIDALGKSSTSVGREHENAVIREKVEAGEDPVEASFLYQIAKDAVEAAAETGDNKWVVGTAVALEAGTEIAQAFLGLATLVGYDPSNTEIAKTLDAVTKMAGDSKPEDYKAGLKDIGDRIQAAKDSLPKDADWQDSFFEVGKAIFGAAVDNPTEFLVDYVAKEFVQEVVPFAIGGAAFAGAKLSSAALKKFGDDAARKIADNMDAAKIAKDATLLSDVSEAAGGSAGGAYEDAHATFIRKRQEEYARIAEATGLPIQELSNADLLEAAEFATNVAQKAGATGAVMALAASELLGGKQLAESLFGPNVNKTAVSAMDEFLSRVDRTSSAAAREGLLEGLEEGAVQYVTDMSIREIDPDRPISANVAETFILSSIIGTNVGGGLTAGAEISDVVANVAKNTSAQVQKTIADAKAGLINAAEAEARLAEFGITSDGFGGVQTSLLNDAFDADYTTTSEAKQAFETANPEFSASDADINRYVGNKPDAELNTQVAEYVDSRFVDAQEIMDAAAAEGLVLTEEQAQQYVKQTTVDADKVLEKIQSNFDELYTTPEEAKQLLIDAGYPEGLITGQTIEEVLGEVGEDGTLPESTVKQSAIDFNADYLLQLAQQDDDDDTADDVVDDTADDAVDDAVDDAADDAADDAVDDAVDDTADDTVDDTADDTAGTESEEVDFTEDLAAVEANLLEQIAANEAAGLDRDEALAEAIKTVSDNLGITETNLLDAIADSESALSDEIAGVAEDVAGVAEDVADVSTAVDDLADQLGITKDELLDTIGQTEEDLLAALGETETALSGEIDTIAAILGKPAQDVTDADINFVTDVIAQQEALADPSTFAFTEEQLTYDVTGDGVIDATDLALLQDVLAGDQTLDPLADNRFAATGLFASQLQQQQELQQQLDQQMQQQMQQQIQMQQQAEQRAKESSARDFLSMLLASEEGRVDVGQSPLAQLEPAYDFSSIFGTPQQERAAAGPYGGYAATNPFEQPPRRVAQGGIIDSNKELLRLLEKG